MHKIMHGLCESRGIEIEIRLTLRVLSHQLLLLLLLLLLFPTLCVAMSSKWEDVVDGRQTVIAPLTEAHSRVQVFSG